MGIYSWIGAWNPDGLQLCFQGGGGGVGGEVGEGLGTDLLRNVTVVGLTCNLAQEVPFRARGDANMLKTAKPQFSPGINQHGSSSTFQVSHLKEM